MWRRGSNEEWERKKSYLIRSLFEDIPQLSDVPEESHSAIDSQSDNREMSYSPLPELTIEQIPDRHDEPKEYYQQLTIRMRKLYKKLFKIKQDTDSDDTIDTVRLNVDPYCDEAHLSTTKRKTNIKDEGEQTNSHQIIEAGEMNNNVIIQGLAHVDNNLDSFSDSDTIKTYCDPNAIQGNQSLNKTYTISCSNSINLISKSSKTDSENNDDENQSTFTGKGEDIGELESNITDSNDGINISVIEEEREMTDSDNNSTESIEIRKQLSFHFNSKTLSTIPEESDQEKDKSTSCIIQASTAANRKDVHNSKDHDDSSGCKKSSRASILSFEKNELEIMRGERKISLDSSFIVNPENNSILNKSFIAQNNSFEVDDVEALSVRSEEFQRENEQCSSPKISNELDERLPEPSFKSLNDHSEQVNLLRRKRNSNNAIAVSFTKKNKTNEATQTDEESVTWDTLKSNFFVGVPKLYKLCTCKNHKCT